MNIPQLKQYVRFAEIHHCSLSWESKLFRPTIGYSLEFVFSLSVALICPTVTKFICKPRKNAQNRFVFQNRYRLSEAIRKILIPSDKCSVNVSDSGVQLSILVQKETHLSDTIRKIWIPLDKWDTHPKVAHTLAILAMLIKTGRLRIL